MRAQSNRCAGLVCERDLGGAAGSAHGLRGKGHGRGTKGNGAGAGPAHAYQLRTGRIAVDDQQNAFLRPGALRLKGQADDATCGSRQGATRRRAGIRGNGEVRGDLTIVAAVFDANGNFIAGTEKILQLRLRDETVRRLEQRPPVTIDTNFNMQSGAYLVRLVVRDAEGQQLTAENAGVQIP